MKYIFLSFFRVQPKTRPSRQNMIVFYPEHPKNPKFTPLSETTSISTRFVCGVPPPHARDENVLVIVRPF